MVRASVIVLVLVYRADGLHAGHTQRQGQYSDLVEFTHLQMMCKRFPTASGFSKVRDK